MQIVNAFGLSDRGQVRDNNEDCFLVDKVQGLCAVCDGMGGHLAGEVASRLTIDVLAKCDILSNSLAKAKDRMRVVTGLAESVKQINHRVYTQAQSDAALEGMGTTLVFLFVCSAGVFVTNVGDSRAYFLDENGMTQLTVDHSWVQQQMDQDAISIKEAQDHKWKNVLMRAVGSEPDVKVDVFFQGKRNGLYLLCSDGLSGFVSDDEIYQTVWPLRDQLTSAVQALIDLANQKGGFDNITAVLSEVGIE